MVMRKIIPVLALLFLGVGYAHAQCDLNATPANFDAQLAALQPGQRLCLADGSYGTFHGLGKSAMATVGPVIPGNVVFSDIYFTTGSAFLTVENVSTSGGVFVAAQNGTSVTTVHNIVFHNVSSHSAYIGATDVSFIGGSIGSYDGCGAGQEDGIQVWEIPDATGAYRGSTRILFDGVKIHDVSDGNGNCSGRHVDCMQILSGHFITVRNSIFYNCPTSDIISEPNRDGGNDIVLENNFFGPVVHPGASLNLSYPTKTEGGSNRIRNNYIDLAIVDTKGSWDVSGNIMGMGSCTANGTLVNNVFLPSYSATCGSGAKRGNPSFVGPTPSPAFNSGVIPNYHLAVTDTLARNAGNPASFPATDIDGEARSDGKPDAGADELGGTAPLPPPPPPPSGPQVGNRISVISTANIRATAVNGGFGTLLGTEPTGAQGTVTMTSTAAVPGVTATWTQVKFDSCATTIPNCTGWMGSNNMTVVTTPPPPPPVPTLTLTCVNLVCTFTQTNIASGTSFPVSGTAAGITANATARVP
jgi:hypothetical protein